MALILTRKTGESIILKLEDGRQIKVTLSEIRRNQARIAFDAPLEIEILREELTDEGTTQEDGRTSQKSGRRH